MALTGRLTVVLLCAIALLSITATAHAVERQMVLVTDAATPLPALSSLELRKLFLGMSLEKQGRQLVAVNNDADALLHEVFLQKVMFMSAHDYERQLLSTMFRTGASRPPAVSDTRQLQDLLRAQPNTVTYVTYMWASDAQALSGVSVVQVLWRGPAE